MASGVVEARIDASALDPLREQDANNARFSFEDIEHVPPASYVAVDLATGSATTTCYWSAEIPATSAEPVQEPIGEARRENARIVPRELEEAVRLRLRADVPVGLYLSGGIDSAFVAALMKRNLNAASLPFLKRLRRDANKVVMYIMQTHMLHGMFVADPVWRSRVQEPAVHKQDEAAAAVQGGHR